MVGGLADKGCVEERVLVEICQLDVGGIGIHVGPRVDRVGLGDKRAVPATLPPQNDVSAGKPRDRDDQVGNTIVGHVTDVKLVKVGGRYEARVGHGHGEGRRRPGRDGPAAGARVEHDLDGIGRCGRHQDDVQVAVSVKIRKLEVDLRRAVGCGGTTVSNDRNGGNVERRGGQVEPGRSLRVADEVEVGVVRVPGVSTAKDIHQVLPGVSVDVPNPNIRHGSDLKARLKGAVGGGRHTKVKRNIYHPPSDVQDQLGSRHWVGNLSLHKHHICMGVLVKVSRL